MSPDAPTIHSGISDAVFRAAGYAIVARPRTGVARWLHRKTGRIYPQPIVELQAIRASAFARVASYRAGVKVMLFALAGATI
jgi:hypothetical protein